MTKCATLTCPNTPTHLLRWNEGTTEHDMGSGTEAICAECAEAYARRPYIMARAEITLA